MTVKELSKLYWLNREVEMNKRQLAQLEADIAKNELLQQELRASLDGISSPAFDGMPHGSGNHSRVEQTAVRLVGLEEEGRKYRDAVANIKAMICTRQTLIVLECERLQKYIDGIGDPITRQIFTYRFVNGLTWEQVAANIDAKMTAESARVSCYRYLKKNG